MKASAKAKVSGGRPETFAFLGLTHYCTTSVKGRFLVGRKTSGKRRRAKLKAMNAWLKAARCAMPLARWWQLLKMKLEGHHRYYGVSGNSRSIGTYYDRTRQLVYKWINRRSQRRSCSWDEFERYLGRHPLPKPRIVHRFYLAPAAL